MESTKTFSIVALICGIVGIVLMFTPAAIVGLILGILAIVFAVMAKKREDPNGMRTAGFVLGIVAIVIFIIYVIIIGMVLGLAASALGSAIGSEIAYSGF